MPASSLFRRIQAFPWLTRTNTDRTTLHHPPRRTLIHELAYKILPGAAYGALNFCSWLNSSTHAGRRTRTVVPVSEVCSIQTVPAWSWTILLTMASPNPVPLGFPKLTNGSNSVSRTLGGYQVHCRGYESQSCFRYSSPQSISKLFFPLWTR